MEKIKIHFDKIFDLLWQEGIVKRYDGIYLITSLLYLKSLEDIESVDVGNRIGEESVFVDCEKNKWSSLIDMDMFDAYPYYVDKIFPFLCLQPLGVGFDSFCHIMPIRISEYGFYQILIEVGNTFTNILEGADIAKDNISIYGDIFECLLTYLDGNFAENHILLAPKNLRQLLCELAQFQGDETVYDPAMGIGNLLVEANKQMLIKRSSGDKLIDNQDGFSEFKKNEITSVSGYWDNEKILEGDEGDMGYLFLAQMNFYFHHINLQQPQFKRGMLAGLMRTLHFDRVISVMKPHRPLPKIIDDSIMKLAQDGIAVLVVPLQFLYNSSKRYSNVRIKLLEQFCVEAVISLPDHEFAPQSSIRTAIIIVSKRRTSTNHKIWFCDLKNDGYSNDMKRIKNTDTPLPYLVQSFLKKEEIHNDWFDSELVSSEEVLENDASLLVAQYIDIYDDIMEEIDLDLIISHLDDLQYKIKGGIDELKRYL